MSQSAVNQWDLEAERFDEAPDHGLRDPAVRSRWAALLATLVPPGGTALDIACGTGSLSLLMAELGFDVVGIDSSPRMIDVAKRKASNAAHDITFAIGDAKSPDAALGQFDVVLGRHILWALPDASLAVANWTRHLLPGGHLVLIEGFWHTGAGLHQHEVEAALPPSVELIRAESLSGDPLLWGGPVTDERFVVTAKLRL